MKIFYLVFYYFLSFHVEIKIKKNSSMKEATMEYKIGEEVTTESGLKYEVIKLGDGAKPGESDKVEVHYHGTLRWYCF